MWYTQLPPSTKFKAMNIFWIEHDDELIASSLCDEHIVKMPLESTQMLATSIRLQCGIPHHLIRPNGKHQTLFTFPNEVIELQTISDASEPIPRNKQKYIIANPVIYRHTHANHPCTIWTRYSKQNFERHLNLLKLMLKEFEYRNGKIHKCSSFIDTFEQYKEFFPNKGSTIPPKAIDDKFLDLNMSLVDNYRMFYIKDKTFASYKRNRTRPDWFV